MLGNPYPAHHLEIVLSLTLNSCPKEVKDSFLILCFNSSLEIGFSVILVLASQIRHRVEPIPIKAPQSMQ